MSVRRPIVAGRFYPSSPKQCLRDIDACLAEGDKHVGAVAERPIGAIVPHAGWVCSGAVAAAVFRAIQRARQPETFVLFGAVHSSSDSHGAMYDSGAWETPMGPVEVDDTLAEAVLSAGGLVTADPDPHVREHSLEVQVPFIRKLFPEAKVLPIMVAPGPQAAAVGRQVAQAVDGTDRDVVYVGSTDLTHYGPGYRFTPAGSGAEALQWAKDVNDRRLLDLIEGLHADRIVDDTRTNHSACGGGAIAAAVAASQTAGATKGLLLWHTTSHEVLRDAHGPKSDSVGYAGVLLS